MTRRLPNTTKAYANLWGPTKMNFVATALIAVLVLSSCRTPKQWTAGPVPSPDNNWPMSTRIDTYARYVPESLNTDYAYVRENSQVTTYTMDSYRTVLDSARGDLYPELMKAKKWQKYWSYSYIALSMLGSVALVEGTSDRRKYAAYAGAAIAGGFTLYFGNKSKSIIDSVTWNTQSAIEQKLFANEQ